MFLGRPYRQKKRKVLLQNLSATPPQPPAMTSWVPPTQHVTAREDDWFRGIYCTHRAFCGCGDPVSHLAALAATFGFQPGPPPSGGPRERLTPPVIRSGLPALPPPATPGPSRPCGGSEGGRGGEGRRDAGDGAAGDDDLPGESVEELLDLLDDAE